MKKSMILVMALILGVLTFAGCSEKTDGIVGTWAYVHDENTAILTLKSNGSAEYNNKKYTYTNDDTFITLKSDSEEIVMRYELEDDGMVLYQNTDYVLDESAKAYDEKANEIVGLWKGKDVEKWEFEFNNAGEFKEDGYFPGYYIVDEENKTIKLVYNDHFEDTFCYYSLENGILTVQYPWKMVAKKK